MCDLSLSSEQPMKKAPAPTPHFIKRKLGLKEAELSKVAQVEMRYKVKTL